MKKFLRIISNPYLITIVVFGVVVLFLDENNLLLTRKLQKEVDELHKEEARYREGIRQDSIQAANLHNSMEEKERFGRETYFLKAKDEDVYIIAEE